MKSKFKIYFFAILLIVLLALFIKILDAKGGSGGHKGGESGGGHEGGESGGGHEGGGLGGSHGKLIFEKIQ